MGTYAQRYLAVSGQTCLFQTMRGGKPPGAAVRVYLPLCGAKRKGGVVDKWFATQQDADAFIAVKKRLHPACKAIKCKVYTTTPNSNQLIRLV